MSWARMVVIAAGAALAAVGAAAQVDRPGAVARDVTIVPRPLIRVPPLPADTDVAAAREILRHGGFTPGIVRCDPDSGRPGAIAARVTAFSPASGTMVPLGSRVDMVAVWDRRCPGPAMMSGRPRYRSIILPPVPMPAPLRPVSPSPPPPPPPPATQTCPDGSTILATDSCPLPPPPPPPPPPEPEMDPGDEPSAVPVVRPRSARVVRSSPPRPSPPETADPPADAPDSATIVPAPPQQTPQPATGGPTADAEKGRGAFVEPGDMELENWHRLEFVVGRTEAALAEESEDQQLTVSRAIYVAPLMRVTLLPDPNFEIKLQSPATQPTGADRAASWQWSVRPLRGGVHSLVARVEVLERSPDGSVSAAETYTRRVAVRVRVGTWKGFLNALRNAAGLGDVLGTLFRSWEKTLLALTALIAAAAGLWAAIRKLRKGGAPGEA